YGSAISQAPWNAFGSAWTQAQDKYGNSDPYGITAFGESMWAGGQAAIGSLFNVSTAGVDLGAGYALRGIGNLLTDGRPPTDTSLSNYIGTVFTETGAAHIGNNLITQGLWGDTGIAEVEKAFGYASNSSDFTNDGK